MKIDSFIPFLQHDSGGDILQSRKRLCSLICFMCGALLFSILLSAEDTKAQDKSKHPEPGSLGEVSAKLSNPVSDVWAMFTEFDVPFSNGDVNTGNANTTNIGNKPVKFHLGIEYSVVKQDAFGQVAQFISVIPSLIKNALFGK